MQYPKAVLFDYGMTLCTEPPADNLKGYGAVLRHAVYNPHHVTAQQLANAADLAKRELGWFSEKQDGPLETWYLSLQRWLLEMLDLSLDVTDLQAEQIYWDAASPATPAPYIKDVLQLLQAHGIPFGVVSNMCFTRITLERRLHTCFPDDPFQFILASSEYAFRKPNHCFFEVALHKIGTPPQDTWFCGDNGLCDVDGSAATGMRPFWYRIDNDFDRCDPQPHVPCTRLSDWRSFAALLQETSPDKR